MTASRLTPLHSSIDATSGITEEQFRHLAGCLSSIVWRTNFDGTRLIAPRWAELTGKPEGELQGGGWLNTIHPEDRPAFADALRGSRVHGSHCDVDCRLHLRDGSYHWFHVRGEAARGDRGAITGLIGIATNIDQQKRAEAALMANEARLRLIMDAARVGTLEHDLTTNRIACSPLALRLLGIPSDTSLTFEQVVSCVHPDDRGLFARAAAEAALPTSNGAFEVVFRSLHSNGSVVWVSARGSYLFEGAGEQRHAVRFVAVSTDLTGRIRDLEERARLSAIVASSNDAIICVTISGRVTHWNESAERIYGYSADEILGKPIFLTVPPELADEARLRIESVAQGTPVTGLLTERVTKAGRRINVSLTISPINDDAGSCVGVSSIVRDVTAQTQLQAELMHAQKMEAIGQLAGGVAHDLNNLLTSMLIGIEFACESPTVSDDTRTQFGEVRSEGFRAASLIRQLLTIARRQVINPRPCTLAEVVNETLPMMRSLLGADIVMATSLAATRGAFVDPVQIGQGLVNLALNARDAMPSGGTLTVSTRDAADGEHVELLVADTGCGMTPEVKAHVFEPFFTTKAEGVGTGLGLSTTYGIVAQSQGTISVESELGSGTCFTIALPAIDAPPPLANPPRAFDPTPTFVQAVQGNLETILIVEDDRVLRDQIVRGIERIGYTVLEAQNGRDALIILRQHKAPIHLVVSDLVMPGMNGAELVSHVRQTYPQTRALLMSGYSERAVRSFGVPVPDTTLLAKPFELSMLAEKIREELDRSLAAPRA